MNTCNPIPRVSSNKHPNRHIHDAELECLLSTIWTSEDKQTSAFTTDALDTYYRVEITEQDEDRM